MARAFQDPVVEELNQRSHSVLPGSSTCSRDRRTPAPIVTGSVEGRAVDYWPVMGFGWDLNGNTLFFLSEVLFVKVKELNGTYFMDLPLQ